jgi:hypothetical protein
VRRVSIVSLAWQSETNAERHRRLPQEVQESFIDNAALAQVEKHAGNRSHDARHPETAGASQLCRNECAA